MSGPTPSLEAVIDGMIEHALADLVAEDSILKPVLDAFGLTLDTSEAEDDPGERVGLFFGDRGIPADGVSIAFIPTAGEEGWQMAPDGARIDYLVTIKSYWRDSEQTKLTGTPGKYWRFCTRFAFALARLYGPASLGADHGGWSVGGGTLLDPMCTILDPASGFDSTDGEIRHQIGLYNELQFEGYVLFHSP